MKFNTALGEVIREQRLAKGLSLRQVSQRGMISMGHLSDVENGRKEGSSVFIECVAKGLRINTYDLIIEAGYRMAGSALAVPDTPEPLFVRDSAWHSQYADLK